MSQQRLDGRSGRSVRIGTMAQTIGTLESEVAKSKEYLDRVNSADQRMASGSLDLEGGAPGGGLR